MKSALSAGLLAIAFICACSGISKRQSLEPFIWPPADQVESLKESDPVALDHYYETHLRRNPSESTRFLVRYRQAKLWSPIDPAKACALWAELISHGRFPLENVARLRAIETCPTDRPEVAEYLKVADEDDTPWLRTFAVQVRFQHAIRSGDRKAELKWLIKKIPLERTLKIQAELFARGLSLAKELEDNEALESLHELMKARAPRLLENPPEELLLKHATDLRRVREFEKARIAYRRVLESPKFDDAEKLQALNGIRMTYKLELNKEMFIQATREYSNFARERFFSRGRSGLNQYAHTRIALAQAVWTEHQPKEAAKILRELESEVKGRNPLVESRLIRARIEEEAKKFNSALKILESIEEKKIHDSDLKLSILWYRAWILRKAGRFKESIERLEAMLNNEEFSSAIARHRFWLAKSLKDLGEKERAQAEFEKLIEEDPIGYYGMLAYRELDRPLPRLNHMDTKIRAPAELSAPNQDHMSDESKLIFEWLLATEESELARRFLHHQQALKNKDLAPEQMLSLLEDYARAGAYQSLFAYVAKLEPNLRKQVLDSKPELIFPRPWSELIEETAKKRGVAPELVYSIIRQESSFDPNARSHADAFGLMQLIPVMAKAAAKSSGLELTNPEDLYNPELNIPLGVSFLRDTLKRWRNRFIPAVASYNASENAVSNWLKTRNRSNVLEFIEDIPYEETRSYVKLVMRNYVFYSRLSTSQDAIPFPEWCLAGIQDSKF